MKSSEIYIIFAQNYFAASIVCVSMSEYVGWGLLLSVGLLYSYLSNKRRKIGD